MDTLVFDIETQNFFTDPDVGRNNFGALKISVVCVYSYDEDKYFSFEEDEMAAVAELFNRAERIVGFSSNRYDIPVLNGYFRAPPDRLRPMEKRTRRSSRRDRACDGRADQLEPACGSESRREKEQHGIEAIHYIERGKWTSSKNIA